jgi:hypothetical protein
MGGIHKPQGDQSSAIYWVYCRISGASPDLGGVGIIDVLLPNLGGSCPLCRDPRIEFAMVQSSSDPDGFCADFDYHVVRFPHRPMASAPTDHPRQSAGRQPTGLQVRVRKHAIHHVVVLDVVGRLGDVVEDLDREIQFTLAEGPRGVVCDLSVVLEGAEPGAAEALAAAGRHVRDWRGMPVAMACPDPLLGKALNAYPLGRHLMVTPSVLTAVSTMLATPAPAVEWLQLTPHPTAARASRDFVTRTLLGWGLGSLIPSASLVISELVTNSSVHAGTDISLSVGWNLGALRLSVRDNSPDLPRQRYSHLDVHGRGLCVVAGLSRAYGVLPTADGGKVVWAVLNAARPLPLVKLGCSEPAVRRRESPDSRAPARTGGHQSPDATAGSGRSPIAPPARALRTISP